MTFFKAKNVCSCVHTMVYSTLCAGFFVCLKLITFFRHGPLNVNISQQRFLAEKALYPVTLLEHLSLTDDAKTVPYSKINQTFLTV